MASEKFKTLLVKLFALTKTGKVRWEDTAREGVFRIALGEGLIRLERSDDDEPSSLVAYLLDNKGQVIDQVIGNKASESGMFKILDGLYRYAHRSVYKDVDHVVDSMLAALKEGKLQELPPEAE